VCACLWCADACVQGVPVARTAGVRYASSSGRAKPKSSAHGQRDVAVCHTNLIFCRSPSLFSHREKEQETETEAERQLVMFDPSL